MVLGLSEHIKVKLGSVKDCIQSVTVELPNSHVKGKIDKAFKNVQGQAKMPGFRVGKMPLDVVKKNFTETAYAQAQEDLLQEGVAEAIRTKNIHAIQTPVVQSVNFNPEKAFQFEFKVEIAPHFKLASYKGQKLTQKQVEIKDDDVQKKLAEIADGNAKLIESKEETIQSHHFVNIQYEGFVEGKPIDGTKTENFLMDMSAPQSIVGLAEGLMGAKVGENREISVKFPDDSPAKNLAGKNATFKVTPLAIKEKNVPSLNDDFAKDLGMESLEQLKSRLHENMEKESEQNSRKDVEKQIIDKLIDDNNFSIPQGLLQKQSDSLTNRQRYRLSQQGIPQADQDKILDGLKAEIRKQAEREVRLAFILNVIAEQEKLSVSDEDVDKKIESILAQTAPQERASMEKMLKGTYRDQVRSELKDTKIFDWLIGVSKIKIVPGGSK